LGGSIVAKIRSSAGEMEVQFTGVSTEKNRVIMDGKFNVTWDWQITLEPSDAKRIIKMAFKPSVIILVLRLPFVCMRRA
jgi:hypothetical protein